MPAATGYWLAILGIILFVLMLTIIGSSVSDAVISKGTRLSLAGKRARWIGVSLAAVLCCGLLYGGNAWWQHEASVYRRFIYKTMQANKKSGDSQWTT